MNAVVERSVCLLPQALNLGGPASFRARLSAGLRARGVEVLAQPGAGCQAVLVIGGVSRLDVLLRARRQGMRIVQRLNGMNWIHHQRRTGLRHFLKAEYNNRILALIRARLADEIVYQSEFSQRWWGRAHGADHVPVRVVFNGVDLEEFRPPLGKPAERVRLRVLMVEGRLGGGYELGFLQGLELIRLLDQSLPGRVELAVAGKMEEQLLLLARQEAPGLVTALGAVSREAVADLDRAADVFFSADVNAACPNSVVEALASGLPVVAFDTGALAEMVGEEAGRVVPWGGNHWRLEPANINALAQAAEEILKAPAPFRRAARERAEALFDINKMVDQYMDALEITT